MNFHTSGWLKRYLRFRLEHPFDFWNEIGEGGKRVDKDSSNVDMMAMDDLFYDTLRQNGVLFGCHVLETKEIEQYSGLRFLSIQDQATFVNVETLFTTLMREIALMVPNLGSFGTYLTRTMIRTVQFYLSTDLETRYFALKTEELLDDSQFSGLIKRFEKKFIKRTRIQTKLTFSNSLQNNFAFLDIYGLITWNRRFHNQPSAPVYYLSEIERNHILLQKQLALIFAGLIWQSEEKMAMELRDYWNIIVPGSDGKHLLRYQKQRMIKRYIKTSRLPGSDKRELLRVVKEPVEPRRIHYGISDAIINKYMLEQTILLSLIDEDIDPFQVTFIKDLGKSLGMTEEELKAGIGSVAEFFHNNEDRFDFIRGNRAFYHIRERIQIQITLIVRKNLDRIMNEIKQTGKLYSLLAKSGSEALTKDESKFVKEQLLSIAKTVPALAIFCLPAGAIVLAVFLKVLPFNILPNSFAD
ncbi:MAG: hypothetical protein GY866_28330 [Proteobacteria bacterium]|nr:hypothetical protein [Pseudomonadota bacterium]